MSQNDYHAVGNELLPGLGADEPKDEEKRAVRSRSAEAMLKLKEELQVAGAELTERERELVKKEDERVAREREGQKALDIAARELAQREAALAQREADLAKRDAPTKHGK